MAKDKHKTEVYFRILNGEVLALFPGMNYPEYAKEGYCMSYLHIGQHGEASTKLIKSLPVASKEEYRDLFEELGSIGYNLKEVK